MSVKRDATKLNAIEFDFVILFGCETNRDQRVNGSGLLNCLQCHFKRMFDVQRSLAPYGKLYRDISLFFSEIDTTERKIDGMKQKRRKSITNDITEMHLVTEQYGVFVWVCSLSSIQSRKLKALWMWINTNAIHFSCDSFEISFNSPVKTRICRHKYQT